MSVPMQFLIEPVTYRTAKPPRGAFRTDLAALCRRAGVRLRATVPSRTLYVRRSRKQLRAKDFDVIGVPVSPRSKQGALRAIEALAYSFHDHATRFSVCGRGIFGPPLPPRSRRRSRRR